MSRAGRSQPNWLGTKGLARISLHVLRYEFPGHTERYDANWLVIRGMVELADAAWSFQDPCLLTWEVEELIEWLRALPNPPTKSLSFIESLLTFLHEPERPWIVQVTLRGEAIPAAMDEYDERWSKGQTHELSIDSNGRDRFVAALCEDLAKFPRRTV